MSDLVKRLREKINTTCNEAADTIEALEGWKAQALAVEAEWDVQTIGKRLNVPLGNSIRAAILPAIEALEGEVERVSALLRASRSDAAQYIRERGAAIARAERLRVALEGIAANADAASDLSLFRVQCRDFARKALEDDKQ